MIWIPVICLFVAVVVMAVTVFLNRAFFAHGIKDICMDRMRTADRRFDFYKDGRTVESDRPSGARGSLWGAVWNEQGEKGIIIFAHGMGNTAAWYLPEILAFAGMGYEVFAFEYHGYGTAGDFCGFGWGVPLPMLKWRSNISPTASVRYFLWDTAWADMRSALRQAERTSPLRAWWRMRRLTVPMR